MNKENASEMLHQSHNDMVKLTRLVLGKIHRLTENSNLISYPDHTISLIKELIEIGEFSANAYNSLPNCLIDIE